MLGVAASVQTTETTVVVAKSAPEISPSSLTTTTTSTSPKSEAAMPSRVPLVTAATSNNCGHPNQNNEQMDTSKRKKDPKGPLKMQSSGLYLFAQNHRIHKHQQQIKTGEKLAEGGGGGGGAKMNNQQASVVKDHKIHYQEEFNKMRERLFRLLSKVPIQVATMNSEYESNVINNNGGTSATASSSSSSSTQTQNFKKINREPLIIKYYNERSLADILDQHFGCSLIKHDFNNGQWAPDANTHKSATKMSFNDASTTTKQCNCNQQAPNQPTADNDNLNNIGCALIYADDLSHRSSSIMPPNTYSGGAQTIYDDLGQHCQMADWEPVLVKCDNSLPPANNLSWQMQLPTAYSSQTIRDTTSGDKASQAPAQGGRSTSNTHKDAKYNERFSLVAFNQRNPGSMTGVRRQKKSSSSSIMGTSRSSCLPNGAAGKQQIGGSRTTELILVSNGLSGGGGGGDSSIYLPAANNKGIENKSAYIQQGSPQTVEHFALSATDSFANRSLQASELNDLGSVSLNAAIGGTSFVAPLGDIYEQQQYHPNHHHHHPQHHHQHRHQADLSTVYSSPTRGSNYQPTCLDMAAGDQLATVPPGSATQQIISFSQHQVPNHQNQQQQQQQQHGQHLEANSYDQVDDSNERRLAYYQTNGYQQPLGTMLPDNTAWRPMLVGSDGGQHPLSDERAEVQQQMIDQQQHRLQNNNEFLASESYTEHDIGFYLAPNANYVVYADCQQTALANGPPADNLILSPHYHDTNQIHTNHQHQHQLHLQQQQQQQQQQHLNHDHDHHSNHHSISRIN